ncbi:Thiol-disulfide oxidoreductase ResA [Tetrabaena socialis]|uniref:glutaredoxin-dependent peroxiredoxin n=1 Tax=Tetrabaena socialis TaxID=47790 RepID=A0A2J8AEW9_9CHLO|nr:Thiol-disulfide oxidoreductase ResA [Tetrabaena socialis]|eukprot:PNH11046.1 Thiol-disulfide oxidoreductase ResA [Tetrabaena socialis]
MVVGTQCPAIRGLTFVKGDPVAIGAKDAKRVLVIECWATWCGPCRTSIPHLTELQAKYKDKEVYIIGISSETNVQVVKKFVDGMGSQMDYTVALDTSGEVQEELLMKAGAQGIPHAFVVDSTNTITFSGHPMDPGFESALRTAAAAAPARTAAAPPPQALPLVTASLEELMALPVKALKELLTERGLSTSDCVEKGDLAKKIRETCATVTYYK